jgi:hypothetical protein
LLGVAFHGGIIAYAFNMSDYFSLQNKGVPTEVEGHTGYVGVNGEGRVVQGDRVPKDSRMMEKEFFVGCCLPWWHHRLCL